MAMHHHTSIMCNVRTRFQFAEVDRLLEVSSKTWTSKHKKTSHIVTSCQLGRAKRSKKKKLQLRLTINW